MTAFPKQVRIRNNATLNEIRKKPCAACRRPGPSDPHHVKSRGAGGGDTSDNLLPLCRRCHQEWHRIGIESFTEKYPAIQRWRKEVGK